MEATWDYCLLGLMRTSCHPRPEWSPWEALSSHQGREQNPDSGPGGGRLCCHPCPQGLIRMQVVQAEQSRSLVIGEQRVRVWVLATSQAPPPLTPAGPGPLLKAVARTWPHLCALWHLLFPFLSGLSFSNPPDPSPCPGGSDLADSPSILTPWETSRSDLNPSSPTPLTPSTLPHSS